MSKQASSPDTSANSSTAGEGANTPASNPSASSHTHSVPITSLRGLQQPQQNMDESSPKDPVPAADREEGAQPADAKTEQQGEDEAGKIASPTKKGKCKNPEHKQKKKEKKASAGKKAGKSDSGSDSGSSDEDSESDSSDSSSTEEEKLKKKKAKAKKSKKSKTKASKKSKKSEVESDSSDSDSDDSASSDKSDAERKAKLKKLKKAKKAKTKKLAKAKKASAESDEDDLGGEESDVSGQQDFDTGLKAIEREVASLRLQAASGKMSLPKVGRSGRSRYNSISSLSGHSALAGLGRRGNLKMPKTKQSKAAEAEDSEEESKHFKRVDQLWDSSIHNFKLKESAEDDDSEFSEYAFLVRRIFNWENQYQDTMVDIKSKQLRAALQDVMKGCKSVSLEAKEPSIDPNLLFLYLDELRAYYKTTLKTKIKAEKKRKAVKKLQEQRSQVKALVGYIDDDYADTKKTLYPLLKAGNITFELMWALFKPNEVAVTSCYGQWDEPRCFKVDYANKCSTMMRGQWWCIEGSYLEYDGKAFGFGDFEVDIDSFKGPRKISSLAAYPLKYHREEKKMRKQIVERGEKFVGLAGMHYKFHKGLAFAKKKKQVLKININGRMMVDPATFRRVNPNYQISYIKPKEADDLFSLSDDEDSDGEGCCSCGGGSDDEEEDGGNDTLAKKFDTGDRPKYKYKWEKNERGDTIFMAVEVDEDGDPLQRNRAVDKLSEESTTKNRTFTEEELLLTSPVLLGFSFGEKLWLEFTISGIHEISWNEDAFDSLVLPPNQKSIVRALVESHKFSAHKAIDDVVQGKGKGLVSVLHGPPGTGKTLTAEGISEMLKCPLYMVSAGELGTDPARLEHELQKILDIAHAWGAILLLDEADVFLEKREVHDIHRNALVSIFLRLLEYFQGILFLTTNRVETFDDAFQSRIHVALRYGELTHRAKKTVWSMFIAMVRKEMAVADFSEHQLDVLARHELNGRQIKNLVRSAQALALHEKAPMGLEHVKRVVEVADTFSKDLRGGTGYIDAMRSYT